MLQLYGFMLIDGLIREEEKISYQQQKDGTKKFTNKLWCRKLKHGDKVAIPHHHIFYPVVYFCLKWEVSYILYSTENWDDSIVQFFNKIHTSQKD